MIRRRSGMREATSGARNGKLAQCFADDLELAFDGRPNQRIAFIAGEIETNGELDDVVGGLPNVPQGDARVTLHK